MSITYTLILTIAIFTTSGNVPGVAVTTEHVPGFATDVDCDDAGHAARVPSDRKYYEVDKTWTCVKVLQPS